jgi:hypothetical protein
LIDFAGVGIGFFFEGRIRRGWQGKDVLEDTGVRQNEGDYRGRQNGLKRVGAHSVRPIPLGPQFLDIGAGAKGIGRTLCAPTPPSGELAGEPSNPPGIHVPKKELALAVRVQLNRLSKRNAQVGRTLKTRDSRPATESRSRRNEPFRHCFRNASKQR